MLLSGQKWIDWCITIIPCCNTTPPKPAFVQKQKLCNYVCTSTGPKTMPKQDFKAWLTIYVSGKYNGNLNDAGNLRLICTVDTPYKLGRDVRQVSLKCCRLCSYCKGIMWRRGHALSLGASRDLGCFTHGGSLPVLWGGERGGGCEDSLRRGRTFRCVYGG